MSLHELGIAIPSAETVRRRWLPPLRFPGTMEGRKTLALALVIGAAVLLLAAELLARGAPHPAWITVLLHGLEGAFVGGVCDWFAVWKTFKAIETNQAVVARGIGRWVEQDLLHHRVVGDKLIGYLEDPDFKHRLTRALDDHVGSPGQVEELLGRLWARIEPDVVEFAVHVDLSPSDLGAVGSVLDDPAITEAAGGCLGEALRGIAAGEDLAKVVEAARPHLPWFVKTAESLGFVDLTAQVRQLGERLAAAPAETAATGLGPALVGVLRTGASNYVGAWNAMPVPRRREAARALVRNLRDPVIAQVASFVVKERERLRHLPALVHHPRARGLVELIRNLVDARLSRQVGDFIAGSLCSIPAAELRAKLEQQAGAQLQLIRINGTVLGFGVGGVLGLLRAFAG